MLVADPGVAADGGHPRLAEVAHQREDGAGREDRVGVDGDQNLVLRRGNGAVERGALTGVGLGVDADARLGFGDLLQNRPRLILRSVVDDDHFQLGIHAHQDAFDGAADHQRFVVRGDDHRDRRHEAGVEAAAARAVLLNDGQHGVEQRAQGREVNRREEEAADPPQDHALDVEGARFEFRPAPLVLRWIGHQVVARLADQFGELDESVAARAGTGNDLRQGGDGGSAVAAAVVQQDDVAVLQGVQHLVDDLLRGHADAPVLRVDALGDGSVAALLGARDRHEFVGRLRLAVGVVGRTEEDRRAAGQMLDQAQRGVEFEPRALGRGDGDVGMGVSVVAERVALGVFAADQVGRGPRR